MTERVTVDVGAQYLGESTHLAESTRLAVLALGTDDSGPYAMVLVGSHPDATKVRLRVGVPHALPDGRVLRLGGIAPKVQRPAVALEIADGPDEGPTP